MLITGNHDHSLVHPDVQQSIRQAVTGGNAGLDRSIYFAHYYDEPELRVYAEHGNQYDSNNDYDSFTKFGDECPGYFFVRLFWNRLEPQEPDLDNWQGYFQLFLKRKLWNLIRPAYELFSQYRTDPRHFERIDVPGIPFFNAGEGFSPNPISGKALPGSPDILFSNRGDPERMFSTDVATENQLRILYHDSGNAEFKKAIDDILNKKYKGQPPDVPVQLVQSMAEYGLFHDDYVTAVTEMFELKGSTKSTKPLKNEFLNNDVYDYVLFGHTHEEKKVVLDSLAVTYFNTACNWSTMRGPSGQNRSRLCYVTIKKPRGWQGDCS